MRFGVGESTECVRRGEDKRGEKIMGYRGEKSRGDE